MLPEYLENLVERWDLVGSRVVCNPPPMDTDLDILVLVDETKEIILEDELSANKWAYSGEYTNSQFVSWKKDIDDTEVNLIVTCNDDWYAKFMTATKLCKERNLMNKADRIALFNEIMGTQPKPYKTPEMLVENALKSLKKTVSLSLLQQLQMATGQVQW